MKKIGIIGTGRTVAIANKHALGIINTKRACISAVLNSSRESGEKWVSNANLNQTQKIVACENLSDFLGLCDGVIICTPNSSHLEYSLKCIENNIPFMVEKPSAKNSAESLLALNKSRESKVFNMVALVYRYSNMVKELKNLAENRLGKIYNFSSHFGGKRQSNPMLPIEWRMLREISGSGALTDYGSHLVDVAKFAANIELVEVTGMSENQILTRPQGLLNKTSPTNDDSTMFVGRTNNNVLASFAVTRLGFDDALFTVAGEGGLIQASVREPNKLFFWDKKIGGSYSGKLSEIAVTNQNSHQGWFDSQSDAFINGIEGLVDSNVATLCDGHYLCSVMDAVEESNLLKKTVLVEKYFNQKQQGC